METKTCTACKETKDIASFYRSKRHGHRSQCKVCNSIANEKYYGKNREELIAYSKNYYKENPNKIRATRKKYYKENFNKIMATCKKYNENNRDKIAESQRDYRIANPDKVAEIKRRYKTANPDIVNAHTAKRRASRLGATPVWLSEDQHWMIKQAYKLAQERTKVMGFKWHVDHVVPLQGKTVCGLHVPWNLQVIPAAQNIAKGNRMPCE